MFEITNIEKLTAVDIFEGDKLKPLLEQIRKAALSEVPDIATAKGRKNIASMANKVARSKTYIDGIGKDMVTDWKKKAKAVDELRKLARDTLDDLKAQVRRPLTEWEETEERRVQQLEQDLNKFIEAGAYSLQNWMELPIEAMRDRLAEVVAVEINEEWAEYQSQANEAKETAIIQIKEAIEKRETYEKEQAELAELRRQAEERAKLEEQERLRKEGEERARLAAEKAAQEAAEQVEREKQAMARQQAEAEQRAREAEQRAERAAEQERARIEAEQAAKEAEAKAREADREHRKKINNTAADAIVNLGLTKAMARKVIEAIAKGTIPNIRINY